MGVDLDAMRCACVYAALLLTTTTHTRSRRHPFPQSGLAKDLETRRTASRARSAPSAICGRGDDLDPYDPCRDFYRNFAGATESTHGRYWLLSVADALPLMPVPCWGRTRRERARATKASERTKARANAVVECISFPWLSPMAIAALRDTSLVALAEETDTLLAAVSGITVQLQHPRPRHNGAWRLLAKLERLKRRLVAAARSSPFELLFNSGLYVAGRRAPEGNDAWTETYGWSPFAVTRNAEVSLFYSTADMSCESCSQFDSPYPYILIL